MILREEAESGSQLLLIALDGVGLGEDLGSLQAEFQGTVDDSGVTDWTNKALSRHTGALAPIQPGE